MVAMNVWPTDAADGSVANEARWRKMARHWAPSGVCVGVGLVMAPSLAGTNLTIRNGACWVDGHFCELLGDQVLTVTANGIAVVRFDPAANTAELVYRDGVTVPAQSPTGVYELPIALITGSALIDKRSLMSANAGSTPRFRIVGGAPGDTVATGANFQFTWPGTEVIDTDNTIAPGVGIFTCPAAWPGRWRFEYSVGFATNTVGARGAWFQDSLGVRYAQHLIAPTTGFATNFAAAAEIVVAAGNFVIVLGFHSAGANLVCNNSVNEYFSGRWVAPA